MTYTIYAPDFPLEAGSNHLPLEFCNIGMNDALERLRGALHGKEIPIGRIVEAAMSLSLENQAMSLTERQAVLTYLVGTLLTSSERKFRVLGGNLRDSCGSGAMYRQYLREICVLHRSGLIQLSELEWAAVVRELGSVVRGTIGKFIEKPLYPQHDRATTFIMATLDDLMLPSEDDKVSNLIKAMKRNLFRLLRSIMETSSGEGNQPFGPGAILSDVEVTNCSTTALAPVEFRGLDGTSFTIRPSTLLNCEFMLTARITRKLNEESVGMDVPLFNANAELQERRYVKMDYGTYRSFGFDYCEGMRVNKFSTSEESVLKDTVLLLGKFSERSPDRYLELVHKPLPRN